MSTLSGPPSSDEKSTLTPQTPSQAPSSAMSKVNTVRPEIVTVQKDHISLLLAKCRNLETQVQANKNLQLVIKDAYSQLEQERKKAAKYQTALIQAENRLTEMVRLQLENSSLKDQLPFLASTEKSIRSHLPAHQTELHRGPEHEKAKTLPLNFGDDEDLEIDGPSAISMEGGYHTMSSHSSGYHSARKDISSLETDGSVKISLSPDDYEDVIRKERLKSQRCEERIKQLENLLEAKSNRNMDALVTQLQEAQKKIDSLNTAIKHKETLLQNYYQGYIAVTKQKSHVETAAEVSELENSSKDELQQIVRQVRADREHLKEEHGKQLVEQRGLFLKEREKTHQLEAQLKACQLTINDLRSRPSATGDFPLTMADLRERNKYLEESVRLHQGSSAKLAQEKDRAVAGLQMRITELEKIKKERAELETQVRQLHQKLSDPSSPGNVLQAKLAQCEKQIEGLQRELEETRRGKRAQDLSCPKCKQWEKVYSPLKRKYENLKQHSDKQQQVILSLQGVQQPQQQQQQQQQHGYSAQSQQQAYPSFHQAARTGTTSDKSSSRGGYVDDDEMLKCENCFKEYPIEQVEKYQEHRQRCLDDE